MAVRVNVGPSEQVAPGQIPRVRRGEFQVGYGTCVCGEGLRDGVGREVCDASYPAERSNQESIGTLKKSYELPKNYYEFLWIPNEFLRFLWIPTIS